MNFQILSCSRISSGEIKSLSKHYIERANFYFPSSLLELKLDVRGRDKRSASSNQPMIAKDSGDFLVLLDERGKSFSSQSFSDLIQQRIDNPAIKTVKFVIGPPYGFDAPTKASADLTLSLSPFTVPSEFAVLLACEQLYRALTIIHRTPYHHD